MFEERRYLSMLTGREALYKLLAAAKEDVIIDTGESVTAAESW